MRTIEPHLQQCTNRIENWVLKNGFKFSELKTMCVHFCQLRKIHDDHALNVYGCEGKVTMNSQKNRDKEGNLDCLCSRIKNLSD